VTDSPDSSGSSLSRDATHAETDTGTEMADSNSTTGIDDGIHHRLDFPVVGIGASAGGLEALTEFLRALDPSTGMAFVLVPHLSPTHESLMASILARSTSMPVIEVQDEPTVEPNHVYVIPPDRSMVIEGGKLRLFPRGGGPRRAIDQFFHSLAEDQTFTAIGVILSGMASDGTAGVQEIKALGGITFAQVDAQYDAMPRNAIATGCIDFILDPAGIAAELGRIARHPYLSAAQPREVERLAPNYVLRILRLVQQKTGVDFSHYKRTTLHRRIARRMVLHRLEDIGEYIQLLQTTPAEIEALYQDILINVTSFFRNPGAFEALKQTVFPRLLRERTATDPVRVWVLGCSTGEEAYSLAMALTEFGQTSGQQFPVQIFATDLNAEGIERARSGVYPHSITEEVSPERLRQFFVESGGNYRIAKSIRDMCVFARHNGISDPPFSRMDLISCRNLLIYLDHVLQQRMIPLMHYALRHEGFLWLGSSETIGSYRDLFDLQDPKHKIYAKRATTGRHVPALPLLPSKAAWRRAATEDPEPALPTMPAAPGYREADRVLLGRYSPPCILIDGNFDIVQFRGDTRPYLSPTPGRASLGLFRMLHDRLQMPIRTALRRMNPEAPQSMRLDPVRLDLDSTSREVTVEIIPVPDGATSAADYLIVFEDNGVGHRAAEAAAPALPLNESEQQQELARLREELAGTKEYLQSVIEQQEAANEELQSANEEIQSTNEELQSINEELETSKEEIQSSNEELATVNDELHNRNAEMNQSNNDLGNLLSSVQLAIVMLGPDLRIRRFTPAAERLLNLIGTDVGRPISDIKLNVTVPDLESMLADVIATVTPRECEAQDRTGCWYSVRLRPYRTIDNRIEGAVVVLVDIDSLKRSEERLRESEHRFRVLADYAPVLIWLDNHQGLQFANRRYLEFLGVTEREMQGSWAQYVHPDDRAAFVAEYQRAVDTGSGFDSECRFRRHDGEYRWMKACARPRGSGDEALAGHVGSMVDITDLKLAAEALRETDRNKNEFLALLAHELRNPLAPLQNVVSLLRNPERDAPTVDWAAGVLARQTRTMTRLVDDLLDISRMTRNRIQLRREIVELRSILERAIEQLASMASQRRQSIEFAYEADGVHVDGDPFRLQQVFSNLLNNASKFTPEGGRIKLEVTKPDTVNGRAVVDVHVRDDGIGMPPELLERIFDPFTQGDASLERQQGGLGIGLTLARNLVELHGGSVHAASDGPGHGSEFVVRLPVTERASAAEVPVSDASDEAARRSKRILLVDDNRDGSDTLAMLLRQAGHDVVVLNDGIRALEIASQIKPEVIMLDIGLPGTSGYDIARHLRQLPATAHALLFAVTGYGGDDDQRRAVEAGFDAHFTKPVNLDELRYQLNRDSMRDG
jgi:two-component system CheB/CheR fusion protein